MRTMAFFTAVSLCCCPALAQVVPEGPPLTLDCRIFGGEPDSWWKLSNPSGSSDWFNVEFNDTLAGETVFGICLDVWDTDGSIPNGDLTLGIYPQSTLFPHTPDISAPLYETQGVVKPADSFTDLVSYSLPCVHLGSTDIHVAVQHHDGDTTTWIAADTSGPIFNRSFASSFGYSTGAMQVNWNWTLGLATRPSEAVKNTLLVNGKSSATIDLGGTLCLTFWGTQVGQRFLLYYCPAGSPAISLLPVTAVGSPFFPGPKPETWEACLSTLSCGTSVGGAVPFCTIYQDFCDLKINGKPKLKLSNTATANLTAGTIDCCYGIKDDGDHDGFVWKVSNPSGSSDWFVVDFGTAPFSLAPAEITSVEIGLTQLCGGDASLDWVGYHPPDPFAYNDPTDFPPDLGQGAAVQNVVVPAGTTSDGAYPGFQVPIAPTPIFPGSTPYLAAIRFSSGDTCIWIASDTDGTDTTSGCGTPVPNRCSGQSGNGFATNAVPTSTRNYAMKLNWTVN